MRQKGFGKKVLSLALAAAMSVSLCAPAWAEEADLDGSMSSYAQQEVEATSENGQSDGTVTAGDVQQDENAGEQKTAAIGLNNDVPALMSQTVHNVSDVGGLKAALESESVQDGDTIVLAANTYDVGSLTIKKAVNLQGAGADKTVLKGTILYGNTSDTDINSATVTVQGIGFDTQNQMSLCFSTGVTSSTLTIADCSFANSNYAVNLNTGATGNTLTLKNTTFTGTWCAIAVKDGNTVNTENVSVGEGVVFAVQKFASPASQNNKYYFDLACTEYVDANKETVTAGQTFTKAAAVGAECYSSFADAFANVAENSTITLYQDVALDEMLVINTDNVTLDLNGNTISASEAFAKNSDGNQNHLVDVLSDNVIIQNGVLQAGSNNNHTLNVWKASNVTLQNLTLDNTNTYGGAPLIVGSSDVTLVGNVTFVTGANSWYSVNVDGAYNAMELIFAENAIVTLGDAPVGIQVDRSKADKLVTLAFGTGTQVAGSTYPLVLNTQADNHPSDMMKVTGLANTNLTETQIAGAVAKIGNCYYDTLASAIKNVADSETITLLCDVPEAEGVSVASGKKFTVDFAGHTYTVSRPGAGSTNTETNAFQLLKDSTITFRNGTLRISEKNLQPGAGKQIMRLIQNYADLTLENMQIYAANQAGGEDYVLSFNNGNITFKGNTSIYMSDPASAIAFDVYYWASSYPNGTKVTFTEDYTGTIQGNIVYDSTDKEKATLTIQGNGGFQGIKLSDGTKNGFNVSVSGGHFVNDPSAYVAEDKMAVTSDKDGYNYKVVTEEDTAAEVVSGEPAVENPAANDATATNDEKALATGLGDNLDKLTVESSVLNATANAVANDNTTTEEAGKAALQKAGINVGTADTVSIVIQPYLDIELQKTSIEGEKKSFQLDITPMYRKIATTNSDNIQMDTNAVEMDKPAELNVTKPVEMTIQLPSDFAADGTTLYVLHQKGDGRRYQYEGTVDDTGVLTFTNPNGFSVFTISTQEFDLSTNDTTDSSNTTTTPAATPAPTAAPQQSGSNITYYTCQACGYHDWTATAEGYKCNHCGYIESVKQLSGYGNVKGVYEPKTSTAAAQTGAAASGTVSSAIPQTGDEQPIAALVVVAVAALLGLGVTVVMKKRNNG